MEGRRIIKTHLSLGMLPNKVLSTEGVKLVYVCRNPRDVVVSYHNHEKLFKNYSGGFDNFFDAFLEGVAGFYSPFMEHVLEYWNASKSNEKSILFLKYEDMKRDLRKEVRKVGQFLNQDVSEEQVRMLCEHLDFKNMKENNAVNKRDVVEMKRKMNGAEPGSFMRKGETGDWKVNLSKDQVFRIEEWESKYLKNTDFRFSYEL